MDDIRAVVLTFRSKTDLTSCYQNPTTGQPVRKIRETVSLTRTPVDSPSCSNLGWKRLKIDTLEPGRHRLEGLGIKGVVFPRLVPVEVQYPL